MELDVELRERRLDGFAAAEVDARGAGRAGPLAVAFAGGKTPAPMSELSVPTTFRDVAPLAASPSPSAFSATTDTVRAALSAPSRPSASRLSTASEPSAASVELCWSAAAPFGVCVSIVASKPARSAAVSAVVAAQSSASTSQAGPCQPASQAQASPAATPFAQPASSRRRRRRRARSPAASVSATPRIASWAASVFVVSSAAASRSSA